MTRGEWLVGVDFNPSGSIGVVDVKAKTAELIDLIDSLPSDFPEQSRLKALACEHIETAAMYAVKAVTKRMRPEPAGYGGM